MQYQRSPFDRVCVRLHLCAMLICFPAFFRKVDSSEQSDAELLHCGRGPAHVRQRGVLRHADLYHGVHFRRLQCE